MAAIKQSSVRNLTAQNATQKLYRNFLSQKQAGLTQGYASSHWEHYRSFFNIRDSEDGIIHSIDGVGFGSCKYRSTAHRILDNLCVFSHFLYLTHRKELFSVFSKIRHIVNKIGLSPTLDVFRQACTLWLLSKYIEQLQITSSLQLIVIGDGYGVFSTLFKNHYPDCGITLVDLPETLMIQSINCQKVYPEARHTVVEYDSDGIHSGFNYCTPDNIGKLSFHRFHIAVNVASFQEMSNKMISSYFGILRETLHQDNLFYCCNREKKTMPDGEVTQINKYPWLADDMVLLDELCPWYHYFFGRYPSKYGLKIANFRVPFVNFYDGPIRHKIVKMKIT